MSRLRSLLPWALLAALVVVPAAGVAALAWRTGQLPDQLRPAPSVVLAKATSRTTDDPVDAVVHITLDDPPSLASPGGSGLVTSVMMRAGQTVRSGDSLYAVDGVLRRAMAGAFPLYRPLSPGDRGTDVRELEVFLRGQKVFGGRPDDSFDHATGSAVLRYQSSVGIRSPSTRFTPDLVVWLASEPFRIVRSRIRVGVLAPAAGEPVADGLAPVSSARLQALSGDPLDISWPRLLSYRGKDLGQVVAADAVPQALVAVLPTGSSPQDASPQAAPALDVQVVLRRPHPETLTTVPTTAVMVDPDGHVMCVWVADASKTSYRPFPVTVTGGEFGTSEVTGEIGSSSVVMNPADALPEPQCPSS